MSPFRRLLAEIHRRSLWQVLGIYMVAGWAALQVVDTMTGALQLPEWFPSLALVLLIIGLPIVLATAFVQEGIGRSPSGDLDPPAAFRSIEALSSVDAGLGRLLTWRNALTGGVLAFAAWGFAAALWLLFGVGPLPSQVGVAFSGTSIAVLPFENESDDANDQYFAEGVHEEILTQLSGVRSLRVMSRASVLDLDGRDPVEVARELDVRYVLEGSVRRLGNQVRITARLTDPNGQGQLWAESYERAWDDLFGVQSEVANRIAQSLDAELSSGEPPVSSRPVSSEAYDFFLRGRAYEARSRTEEDLTLAADMYAQAVEADSLWAPGWSRLGAAHRRLYWFGFDRTEERLAQARAAVDRALEIAPSLPDAHVAKAWYLYQIDRDYDAAIATLDLVSPSLDFEPELRASIYRRAGDFERAVRSYREAFYRSPRSSGLVLDLANSYVSLGQHVEANRSFERAQEIGIPGWGAYWWQAWNHLLWTGDTDLARASLEKADNDPALTGWRSRSRDWYVVELLAGNLEAALSYVSEAGEWIPGQYGDTSRDLLIGEARHRLGDPSARAHFESARQSLEERLADDPEDAYANRDLAWTLARLGDESEAVRRAGRSVEPMSISRDALLGPDFLRDLAAVYTIVGRHDEAVQTLVEVVSRPGRAVSGPLLKLDPVWEPLRGNPRFERLIGET